MAHVHKPAARSHGRVVPRRTSRVGRLVVGLAVLLSLALIVGLALQTRGPDLPAVIVSVHGTPPNAEPNGRAWGPADAPIKIEEFVDYQCPACQEFATEVEAQVSAAFASSGKVRYEVHNFQFKGEDSQNAAEGSYCAAEQNSFWPFHSSLYASLPHNHVPGIFGDERLSQLASKLGLDAARFDECLASDRNVAKVEADYQEAVRRGIQSTPTFVINGQPYPGVMQLEDFKAIIAELAPDVVP